jgi:hypothetical protein
VSDRIALGLDGPTAVLAAATAHRDVIASETLARAIELGGAVPGAEYQQAVDVDGHQVTFSMRRLGA